MTKIVISPVTEGEIHQLDVALRALSSEMGDRHVATVATLKAAFAQEHQAFHALLASRASEVVGVIVWTPVFSTTRGGGGLFVSDLWVASTSQGAGHWKQVTGPGGLRRGKLFWCMFPKTRCSPHQPGCPCLLHPCRIQRGNRHVHHDPRRGLLAGIPRASEAPAPKVA